MTTTFKKVCEKNSITLDPFHKALSDLHVRSLIGDGTTSEDVDKLLNECPNDAEYCNQCFAIFCPFGEPLHFHHDGCPCCYTLPDELDASAWREMGLAYHEVVP